MNTTNDQETSLVLVRIADVGVTKIEAPLDTIAAGTVVTPACSVYNYGNGTETYLVRMKIGTFYEESTQVVGHSSGTYAYVTFPSWTATQIGTHTVACTTKLIGDINTNNDPQTGSVTVKTTVTSGWAAMANILTEPSTKKPKSGTCLAAYNDELYLLKASNTQDFAKFTPNATTGIWTVLESIPKGDKLTGDGKKPKKGASMVAYAPTKDLYVLRGNNTHGFWKFHTDSTGGETLGWKKLANITTGLKNPKDASGMVVINKGSNDYIFTMKGSKTNEFYLYDIAANTWAPTPTKPTAGTSTKVGYKKGSCLVYDGSQYVYILKGTYSDMFRYSVASDSFVELKRFDYKAFINRLGKKKKVGEGSGMVFYNDNLYIMKGGNTTEFWRYEIVGDTYVQMDSLYDIPLGPTGKKKVKAGGALAMLPSGTYAGLYAAKGANTQEFYYHSLPTFAITLKSTNDSKAEGAMGKKLIMGEYKLLIPNPAKNFVTIRYSLPTKDIAKLKIYNVLGNIVYSATSDKGFFRIEKLPAGIYLVRFESGSGGYKTDRKIIVVK